MFDWMSGNEFLQEFQTDTLRLLIAVLFGGLLGFERQVHGQSAGMRTHMLVALGAAIFTIAAVTVSPNAPSDVTRVIQGIAAGIGFLGAGTILKLSSQGAVKGLTTASSIWLAAALGTVARMGQYALAVSAGLISLLVLGLLRPLSMAIGRKANGERPE
jgi:putative Mg2+ transporter-C (MgtC) family protein